MPAGIHRCLRPVGRTVDVLNGIFHECLQELVGFYALRVSLQMSLKVCFNECLQGLIDLFMPFGLIPHVIEGNV